MAVLLLAGCAASDAARPSLPGPRHTDPLVAEWVEYLRAEFPGYSEEQYLLEAERFAVRVGGGVCGPDYSRVLFTGEVIPC